MLFVTQLAVAARHLNLKQRCWHIPDEATTCATFTRCSLTHCTDTDLNWPLSKALNALLLECQLQALFLIIHHIRQVYRHKLQSVHDAKARYACCSCKACKASIGAFQLLMSSCTVTGSRQIVTVGSPIIQSPLLIDLLLSRREHHDSRL